MPSKKGYLVPEIINTLTTRCVTFYVPDDIWWLAAFWGQMTSLADTWMWEGTDEQREQIVAVWSGVLASARENFELGDCELTLEFRSVGGRVEYRPYPSAGWVDIGVACPCPTVIPSPEYNPDVADPAELACNIAVGIIEWLMTKYNDTLDAITAATSTAGAFDAIFLIFPPAYLIADIVMDAIQEVINASVAVARAYDTVERREQMQEWLYCEMLDTGEMVSEDWSGLKDAFISGEFGGDSPGRAAMYAYLQTFEEEAILARARIESYGSGNCVAFNCGENWEYVLDFETEQSKLVFVDRSPFTSQVVTEGLEALTTVRTEFDPDLSSRRVDGTIAIPYPDPSTRITEGVFDYVNGFIGNGNSNVAPLVTFRLWTSGSAQVPGETSGIVQILLPDGIVPATMPGVEEVENGYKLYMAIVFTELSSDEDQPVTGNGVLRKLTIKGTGKNPFVE